MVTMCCGATDKSHNYGATLPSAHVPLRQASINKLEKECKYFIIPLALNDCSGSLCTPCVFTSHLRVTRVYICVHVTTLM